jgi:hypothetical protein
MKTQVGGYIVWCVKFTPMEYDKNDGYHHNTSELVSKHIPVELKESFLNLLKEKNTDLISEEEYNEWRLKQK